MNQDRRSAAKLARSEGGAPQVGPADFAADRARREAGRRADDLHICPACDSELVQPTEWSPAAGRRWLVDLRCPDCEWTGGGTYSQRVVDRFDEVLDNGTEAMLEDLTALARANMQDHVEKFVAALDADRILPEDF